MQPIYLDHASTTPILPEATEAIHECLLARMANPASAHAAGRRARAALEDAREGIAELLGLDLAARPADRLIFTSGGTEANNLAMAGMAPEAREARLAISAIEHPSVRAPALRRSGERLVELPVDALGRVDLSKADELLTADVAFSSVQWVNHETGVVQPIAELAALCAARGIGLHCDASQAIGKLPVSFRESPLSAMTVSPHKFGGPISIGALAVRGGLALAPGMIGGGQQLGQRAGTENVALAVGLHVALRAALAAPEAERGSAASLFESRLRAELPDVVIHGEGAPRSGYISNVAFPGTTRQALLIALDLAGVACSAGSACASGSPEPSPTLRAMRVAEGLVGGSLRFSFGPSTRLAEVEEAVRRIVNAVNDLRHAESGRFGAATHRVSPVNPIY